MLSYYIQKGIIKTPRLTDINQNSPNKFKNLKILPFNQENMMNEIESIDLQKNQDKKNLNDSNISRENGVSSGSDSEPSLDNFDNEQLVRLLPTYSKKKSKLIFILKFF